MGCREENVWDIAEDHMEADASSHCYGVGVTGSLRHPLDMRFDPRLRREVVGLWVTLIRRHQ